MEELKNYDDWKTRTPEYFEEIYFCIQCKRDFSWCACSELDDSPIDSFEED